MAQRKPKIFSRREIEGLIAEGRAIVIVDGNVLKVDAWLPYHPGGDKAIRHMIGRDATDEVQRYVCRVHATLYSDIAFIAFIHCRPSNSRNATVLAASKGHGSTSFPRFRVGSSGPSRK
jgi:hypothetical protein